MNPWLRKLAVPLALVVPSGVVSVLWLDDPCKVTGASSWSPSPAQTEAMRRDPRTREEKLQGLHVSESAACKAQLATPAAEVNPMCRLAKPPQVALPAPRPPTPAEIRAAAQAKSDLEWQRAKSASEGCDKPVIYQTRTHAVLLSTAILSLLGWFGWRRWHNQRVATKAHAMAQPTSPNASVTGFFGRKKG